MREGDFIVQPLSVIIPVYNEEASLDGLLDEIKSVLGSDPRQVEILVIDDGSRDDTPHILRRRRETCPALRVLTFAENAGQSAAMAAGFRAASMDCVVAMDGDGQSDPADIPRLAELLDKFSVVCGFRAERHDTLAKRWGSRLANAARRSVTGDRIIDIGCSLKAFHREPLQDIPYFEGSHRFLPVLLAMQGCSLTQIPVNHRGRSGGRSKYTNWGRLRRTWIDLLGVRWLQSRTLRYQVKEDSTPAAARHAAANGLQKPTGSR